VSFFITIIAAMLSLDLVWWFVLARLAPHPVTRVIVHLFMAAQLVVFIWLIGGRVSGSGLDRLLPKFAVTNLFIWHFIALGLLSIVGILSLPILLISKMVPRRNIHPPPAITSDGWTRRDFLRFGAAIAPPLLTLSASTIALRQLDDFRIRRFRIDLPGLPVELDGLTIAQVSDMHVGRFTSGRMLDRIVEATNRLQADLVLLTGDLINDALADLDHGLDLVRAMQARLGLFLIEGNHDLIENPSEFERRVKASGIPFLLDESAIVSVHGFPLQLLGLSWTRTHGEGRDKAIAAAVNALLEQRGPDAFPILLAHHPHAFDAAAAARIPLTLSGHTHGGQLMWNEQIGFGPAMFRYWSGWYRQGVSQLVVSNGVGNWFPLRVNAPAEIVHLTLRSVVEAAVSAA
jgi:predicted MPP superfamily phosphohydrolase